MTGELPQAVAFDCDGTIADTESLSVEAWRRSLVGRGLSVRDGELDALVGWPFAANWARFAERVDLGLEEQFRATLRGHFLELFEAGVEIHTDVVGVMRELSARGVLLAVVSSSNRAHVDRVLDRAGVAGLLATVVASEDTVAHKPDPEPYLEACRRLGVVPAVAAAVEDTATGASAARRAGLRTIGVLRRHSTPQLRDACHAVTAVLELDLLRFEIPGGSSLAPDRADGPSGSEH